MRRFFAASLIFLVSAVFAPAVFAQQLTLTQQFCTSEEVSGTGEFTCFALTDGTPNVWGSADPTAQPITRTDPQRFVYSFAGGATAQLSSVRFITGDGWNGDYRTREIRVQTTTDANFATATWATATADPYYILPDTGNDTGQTVVDIPITQNASARFVRLEVTDTYGRIKASFDRYATLGEFSVFGGFAPALSVNKSTTTPTRSQFEQASYSIVVTNTGTVGTASGDVRVTDTLPSGFTFASASFTRTGGATGPGGATSGALVNSGSATVPVFNGFTLPGSGSVTITLLAEIDDAIASGTYHNAVTASSISSAFSSASDPGTQTDEDVTVSVVCPPGNISNTATVSSATNDLFPADNTSSVCVTFTPDPILRVVKTDSPDPVRRGENLIFTLLVTNSATSQVSAPNVVLNDVLPSGLTWVSTNNSNGGGTCTVSNLTACNCSAPGNSGTVTCQMGTLAIGASRTVVITTKVN